jgi:Fe-S-cluster containining protein
MDIDLSAFFRKYEDLVNLVDQVFEQMAAKYPECVKCHEGCADCCHALFDLSLVEALYINHKFLERFKDAEREELLEIANTADRQTYKLKRRAYKDLQAGKSEDAIIEEMTAERVRCPLLDSNDRCILYEYRPITCRFYGIPTAIGGSGRTCGFSGFEKGQHYPTVNLEAIHQKLYELSKELARHIGSRYPNLAEVLVPLSMALLTTYDEAHLGIKAADEESDKADGGEKRDE